MNTGDSDSSSDSVDSSAEGARFRRFVSCGAVFLKLLFGIAAAVVIGLLPLLHGARILTDNINQGNFVVFDDCGYFEYFSTANSISLIIAGLTNLGLAYLAISLRLFKPILVGILLTICASFFLTFGGCLNGK